MAKAKKMQAKNLKRGLLLLLFASIAVILLLTQNRSISKDSKAQTQKSADSKAPHEVDCSKIAQKDQDNLASVLDEEAATEACEFMGCSSFFN